MKKILLLVAAIGSTSAFGQSPSAIDAAAQQSLLRQFSEFSSTKNLESPEARQLLAGEAANWRDQSVGAINFDKVVQSASDQAVARIPANGDGPDYYLYLQRIDGQWKIVAGRSLALTGIIRAAKDELEKLPTLNNEQQAELLNIRLTLSSDHDLAGWLKGNRDQLDQLRREIVGRKLKSACNSNDSAPTPISAKLSELGLSCFFQSEGGRAQFVIGGMVDNEVGLLFIDEGVSPPPITPNEYIWVEPLEGGWYLYRTT